MCRTTENSRMRNPPCVSCRMSSVVKPTSQLKMNWLHPVVKVTLYESIIEIYRERTGNQPVCVQHFINIFSDSPRRGALRGISYWFPSNFFFLFLSCRLCYLRNILKTFFLFLFKFQNQTLVVNGNDARTATKSRLSLPPYLHVRAPTPQVTKQQERGKQMRSSVNSISMSLP